MQSYAPQRLEHDRNGFLSATNPSYAVTAKASVFTLKALSPSLPQGLARSAPPLRTLAALDLLWLTWQAPRSLMLLLRDLIFYPWKSDFPVLSPWRAGRVIAMQQLDSRSNCCAPCRRDEGAIPPDPTDIHFVVQDPIAAFGIAVDCAETQSPPPGAWIASLFNSAAIRFDDFPTT